MIDNWVSITYEDADESALTEADRLIHGPRQEQYDHPLDAFESVGRAWGAILGIPDVPPEKVGLCMAAFKLCREAHKHSRDNLVDAAGYTGCVEMVHNERSRRDGPS